MTLVLPSLSMRRFNLRKEKSIGAPMNEDIATLADIIEPARPVVRAAGDSWLVLGVILVTLTMVAALVTWQRGRKKRRARAQLRRLQQAYLAGTVTPRELAYRLAAQLRDYFHQHRLDARRSPSALNDTQHAAWQAFLSQLDRLRYEPRYEVNIPALLADARRWLR